MKALDPSLDLDLIIVQGSINDRMLYPTGYNEAVNAAWDILTATYPGVPIVILGPAPHVLPVEEETIAVDAALAELAAQRSWWYISPLKENWITDTDYLRIIDTSAVGRNHPSTPGHRYLAERLATAIDAISR
jgi:lysophospholipase L1-like esterase